MCTNIWYEYAGCNCRKVMHTIVCSYPGTHGPARQITERMMGRCGQHAYGTPPLTPASPISPISPL